MMRRMLHPRPAGTTSARIVALADVYDALTSKRAAAVLSAGCQAVGQAQTRTLYTCPMHPKYVSDRPGDCPICGMRLVPVEKGKSGRSADQSGVRLPAIVRTDRPEPIAQDRPQGRQGQTMPDMPGMGANKK